MATPETTDDEISVEVPSRPNLEIKIDDPEPIELTPRIVEMPSPWVTIG